MRIAQRARPFAATLALLALFAPARPACAQTPATAPSATAATHGARRVLTLDDYGVWKRIVSPTLSPDGKWMAYAYAPNDGDDTLYVKPLDGGATRAFAVGVSPVFSNDSRWAAFTTSPPEKEAEKLRKAKKPVPRTLHILELATGRAREVEDVASFTFSDDASFLAVHRARADRDTTNEGADLLLHDLRAGTVQNIGNVAEFEFNDASTMLAYTVDAASAVGNGLYVLDLRAGTLHALDTGSEKYARLTWSDDGTRLAVLRGEKPEKMERRVNGLVVFTGLDAAGPARLELDSTAADFPDGFVISELGDVSFTKDGGRVFFGIARQQTELEKSDEPRANVDVWHWNDEDVQSVQMVRADANRRYTYLSVFNLGSKRFLRLADDDMRSVTPTADGRWGIGRRDEPYRHELSWGGSRADYIRIDLDTGARQTMVTGLRRAMGTSPDGRHFLFFQDSTLFVRDIAAGTNTDLSALAGVSFVDATDDHPYEKPAYGLGAWSADGRSVIVDDRYDLWQLPLDGSGSPRNLTAGIGQARRIVFRVVDLDAPRRGFGRRGAATDGEDNGIDTSKPILLSAYGDTTKYSGYWQVKPGEAPRPLLYEDRMIGQIEKADSAGRVIFTQQTFEQFPDYWVADLSLRNARQVTDANPQLAEFAWGTRRLIDYTDARGNRLQATLTLPANYQPGQRYPMLVYFYETMSEQHHRFSMPVYDDRPHMSEYASDGYLVLMPDIVYEIGRPGSSALDDIGSAVHKVIELGYADPDHIGLQGHSWGGYQSSFIVTQTDMFAAVVTGAPPTDLTSFYDELYKSTGTVQQGITEIGQVRMGRNVNPWTAHELYESQSPVHQAEGITTPFLILQGTDDGAVDWDQGLEFYNAARRLGKKVIFLSYPGEGHHLAKEENQKDFQIRMKQFFDHYLKGTPAPSWMTEGVPFLEKKRADPKDVTAGDAAAERVRTPTRSRH